MAYIKAENKTEQQYFDFLEDLRQSGDTNMFGAGIYLQQAFGMGRTEATGILSRWMKGHDDKSRILDGPQTKTKRSVKFRQVVDVKEEAR